MKKKDKLRASWSKKGDSVKFQYPLGNQTKCDASFLASVLTDEVAQELERRGYDKATIKFSIEPRKGNTNFSSQRKEIRSSNFVCISPNCSAPVLYKDNVCDNCIRLGC